MHVSLPSSLALDAALLTSGFAEPSAASPRDRALAGLIAKGHGREACAAYLGVADDALMERVVALGLPTPNDRPLPARGGKAWPVLDTRRLIDLWCRNLSGTRLAGLLGRSASSVYGKARRLGLFRRPRSALLRDLPLFPGIDLPAPEKRGRQEYAWTEEQTRDLEARWFSLQSHRGIARDLGISPSAVASAAHRFQLPQRFGLALAADYQPEQRAAFAHLFSGWTRRICNIRKRPFWTRGRGVRFSEAARRQAAYRAMQGGNDDGNDCGHAVNSYVPVANGSMAWA